MCVCERETDTQTDTQTDGKCVCFDIVDKVMASFWSNRSTYRSSRQKLSVRK